MKRPHGRTPARRGQRGFTLIELMIALVVSSLLVGMILAIFSRMSLAYRGQQQIAGVQQVLAAARATIEADAKQAGFAVAQGFKVATPDATRLQWPVQITDSSTGPDRIAFFYADSSVQSVVTVTPAAGWGASPIITVDSTAGFVAEDLVVLAKVDTTTAGLGPTDANRAKFTSCIMQIAVGGITATTLRFSTTAPWGEANSTHCETPTAALTMVYKFVARGYKIDTTRPALGALRQSPTGGLFGTEELDQWTDVAYGFTDIQSSLRIYDANTNINGVTDFDGDGDAAHEWLSGAQQTQASVAQSLGLPADACAVQQTISLVARTDRDVEGVATAATPELRDAAKPDSNSLGNRASVALPSGSDPALAGPRIYRYLTFQVDFRNLGVGL